uniref:Uncharacterized protein n=1 Tax=Oryza meridionalis TaxID=40149 RepID=A0A0E0DM24_9ORYZ
MALLDHITHHTSSRRDAFPSTLAAADADDDAADEEEEEEEEEPRIAWRDTRRRRAQQLARGVGARYGIRR